MLCKNAIKLIEKKVKVTFEIFFVCVCLCLCEKKKVFNNKKTMEKIYTKKNIVTKKRGLIYRVISEKKFTGLKKSGFFFF